MIFLFARLKNGSFKEPFFNKINVKQKADILNYYDQLANEYDQDRFQNSYGTYLDQQERSLLRQWLKNRNQKDILDLGCGTGRLLNFAGQGLDFSSQMLVEAKKKYPKHQLTQSDISRLPFEDGRFKTIFSMHVFMHLDMVTIERALSEAHRVLDSQGIFIFDFPNIRRRKAIRYRKSGWHGNTAMDLDQLQSLVKDQWTIQKSSGFLLFPIHRLPKWSRKFFRPLDSLLCQTFLKHFSSYYCVSLKKKN